MAFSIEYNPDELTTYIYDGVSVGRSLIRQYGNSVYAVDTDKIYVVVSEVLGSTTREVAKVPVSESIVLISYTAPV